MVTPPSHGGNTGSNPVGNANHSNNLRHPAENLCPGCVPAASVRAAIMCRAESMLSISVERHRCSAVVEVLVPGKGREGGGPRDRSRRGAGAVERGGLEMRLAPCRLVPFHTRE